MGKLILVRHGQSLWNKENKFSGKSEVGLSNEGIIQANNLNKKLNNYEFDLIFCSELKRAKETLNIIFPNNKTCFLEELNEKNYGDLQDQNKDKVREEFGIKQVEEWRRGYDVHPPHGESMHELQTRVLEFFNNFILPNKDKNILVVSSENPIRFLIMRFENLNYEEGKKLEVENCKIYEYII